MKSLQEIDKSIELALQHQQARRFVDAKNIYQQILNTNPEHTTVLNLLGILNLEMGNGGAAVELINKAIFFQPGYFKAHINLGIVYQTLGEYEKSVECFEKAIEINPQHASTYYNLGNTLLEQGALDSAVVNFNKALCLTPKLFKAHINLGNVYRKQGELGNAIKSYKKAIKIKPDYAIAHYNLANTLVDHGALDSAVKNFKKALSIRPDFYDGHNNLGNVFLQKGELDKAEACFHRVIELAPDHIVALNNLGAVFHKQGKQFKSIECYREVLKLQPNNIIANTSLAIRVGNLVPGWHVPMMNDDRRNQAYKVTLQKYISTETQVLEIGTGSGLLAMMAARSGAEKVTTCEMSPIIADTAEKIVEANGLSETITVINKKSTNIEVGVDLPRPADILLSEILSSEFLEEGVLSSIEDAKRRLLRANGRMIPSGGSIMIALFGGENISKNILVEDVCGFDLRAFNSISQKRIGIRANDFDVELLSDGVEVFNFDFAAKEYHLPEQKTVEVRVTSVGRCVGLIQWNRLQMDENTLFENHPSVKAPASAWQHVVYTFDTPIDVSPKQRVIISAEHNRDLPWFGLVEIRS